MKIDLNTALNIGGAASSLVVVNEVLIVVFGVKLTVLIGCMVGAGFAIAFYPPISKVSKHWVWLLFTLVAAILTPLVSGAAAAAGMTWAVQTGVQAGLGLVIATSPVVFVKMIRRRLGATDEEGGANG